MSSAMVPLGQFFEQDDDETLELLLLSEVSNQDMHDCLDGIAARFRDDFKADDAFWKNLAKTAEEVGFRFTGVSTPSPSSPESDTAPSFPAAFETEPGKQHIQATSSLLRISESRAVKLTLSALRALNGGDDAGETHIQSLLGTRDLLKTVRDYHYQQRLARLQAITECLRIEQDDDAPNKEEATSVLDSLDKRYVLNGRIRGLFQTLLTTACAPYSPPTRDELLPTLKLRSEAPESLQEAQKIQYADSDAFVTNCFQASRIQTLRERVQAMEALLVLLYHRIDQGIFRSDYALILLAFDSCGTFFTTLSNKRLSYLAGLICAECMSLWVTASTEIDATDGAPLCIIRHPILQNVIEGNDAAVHEMEALLMLLTKFASQVPARKLRGLAIQTPSATLNDNEVEAPESIALFSFGLLLCLVAINMPAGAEESPRFDFEKHGMECAQIASDDCGVFDYLHATMESLVKTPIQDSFSSESNLPYDWQFSGDSSPLLLEGPSEQEELNAADVAYASIGLELLSSTIMAFQSTIRTGNCISLENVTMLCSLAATIYGNHPLLCEAFWKNLELYTSVTPRRDEPLASKHAICYLVDAAHACAASALNAAALAAVGDHPGLEEDMLPSLVPLLQLMSALCSSSGMVESVLKLLPKGIIRLSLLCCAPASAVKDTAAFKKNALQIVEAVRNLARVGRSSSCRAMLRSALEEEDCDIVDGPRVLYRILSSQQDTYIVSSAIRLIGYFVESATGEEVWVAKMAKYFGLGNNGFQALLTGQSSSMALSGLHVLSGFVGNMTSIAFCPKCEQTDTLDALSVVVNGVMAACALLTTLLSSTPNQDRTTEGLTYLVAHGVLRCLAMFLRQLRPIINMHASLRVKSGAQQAREVLIQNLSTSTSVAQAVAYYASAPVSLSLAIELEEMLRNANIMQIASDEYARETEPLDFGAWRSITDASRENKPAVEFAKVRLEAQNLVSNIREIGLDFQGFQEKGWTNEATAMEPLLAASAALDLLRLWELSVDEIVSEQHGIRNGDGTCLGEAATVELRVLSPCRLIFSQIVKPSIVEATHSLRQVWPTDSFTLFDVLLWYLGGACGENRVGASSENMPCLVAADVLSLALVKAKLFDQTFRIPFSDAVIRSASGLSLVLNQAVMDAAALMSGHDQSEELTTEDDRQVRKALACLRLLSVCMELDPRVIVAIYGSESSLLDGIINILNSAASSLRGDTSFEQISIDARLTSHLRIASASVHAILTLWKSSCMPSVSRGVSDVVVAAKRSVVADVISIVECCSLSLSTASILEEPNSVHAAAVLASLASDALEVLAAEMNRESGELAENVQRTRSRLGEILKVSFPALSMTFSKINAAVATAHSWSKLEKSMQSLTRVSVHDPRAVLCSFPASYRSQLESHETQENLCDVVAAMNWLLPLQKESYASVGALKMNNASFILLSKQLILVSSWGRFATMFSLATGSDREMPFGVTPTAARTVLVDLGHIATDIEEAQMLVCENYLQLDVGIAADMLSGLLVETVSRYSRMISTMQTTNSSEMASVYEILVELGSIMEKLLSSTCLNRPSRHIISLVFPSYQMRNNNKVREDTAHMCCVLQKRLLTAAGLLFTVLDQTSSRGLSPLEDNRLAEAALKFVEMACKGIELVDGLSGSALIMVAAAEERLSEELLEASVSLLTLLFSRERGSKPMITGDDQFFANAAVLMKRANVMRSLVSHVDVASRLAVNATSKDQTQATTLLPANESHVRVVQTIFSFVRTVAEIGHKSDDMLSLLSSAALSKMILDNPLLIAANKNWVSDRYGGGHVTEQPMSAALRGYIPLAEMPVGIPEGDSRTIVTGTFLSGRDDPVHVAWRTALKILQTTVSAYARPRDTVNSTSRHFLDIAIAFLKTYYPSLISCLEQCSSISSDNQRGWIPATSSAAHVAPVVLTFNSLCETADILALVSSLCSGEHLQSFESVCPDVYHGMIRACHAVLDGLSKFLAAAGTAKEIFTAMKDYDAELQENANRESDTRFGFNETQLEIDPLLSAGIPSARHEAIKYATYANRCCALVTSEDYEGLPKVPNAPRNGPFSTSSLEKDSQLSMNSPFMLRMEHDAAVKCVTYAITVLSETHPASCCFVMFSPEERRRRDMLSLLRAGMIVSALSDSTSDVCRYYRILRVDTVRRQCHVSPLDDIGTQDEQILPIDKVNGVEDTSKRKPVLSFSPALSSFSELESSAVLTRKTASLSDVVVVLKWCYQSTGGPQDSSERKLIRKILAESASALLSTEMSLHEAIGTFSMTNPDEVSKRVMSQLLQLYDDSAKAPTWSGRLKQIMEPSIWHAVQQQLAEELKLARNDQREKKLQSLNRTAGVNYPSPWYNASDRHTEASSGVNLFDR